VNTLPATERAGDPQEAGTLARELAAAYRGLVEQYRDLWKMSPADALAKPEEAPGAYLAGVLKGPADQVQWHELAHVARTDPEAAARRWQGVQAEALAELRSGHRAAKAMEGYGANAWARAQFLAVRRELTEGWQPRNGVERQLIDMMAQAQTAQLYWLETLTFRASCSSGRKRDDGRWEAETVEDAEAVEQAAAMAERFHGMFLRTLKALRELRRTPGVVVQNAGQVNVGQQQLNVGASHGPAPTPAATIP
jgi:hypothetical protein